MEHINKMLFDICSIVLLIIFIKIMYKKRYTKLANEYMENQFGILGSSSIVCLIVLNVYFYLEDLLKIDSLQLDGIFITIFFLIGGILTNKLYELYFKSKESRFEATNEEYLLLITISFINVSIWLYSEEIIGLAIPVALLIGRFVWLDTKNLRSIISIIKIDHERIKESSLLYLLGTIVVSFCIHHIKLEKIWELWLSIGYGLIILYPYNFIVTKILNKKL